MIDMSTPRRDLISRATRSEFRSLMTSVAWGAIGEAFADEDFRPVEDIDYDDTSVRRTRTEQHLRGINWSDPGEVSRAVRVFERLVAKYLREEHADPQYLAPFQRELLNDGYRLTHEGRIAAVGPALPEGALADLTDASAIEEHLDRLARAADVDPAQAVGSAKELIESTAKVVLMERGLLVDDRADIPELVKAAQEALLLHPTQQAAGPDGTQAVKKILGGLSTVALGVAELRNRGYGTGHGPAVARVGLRPRHAHLAVNASITWCRLMLDTLADPEAPWVTAAAPDTSGAAEQG